MSCSVAPNELPYIVFTNSREDYRVTVRSHTARMPDAERLIEDVARRCGRWLDDEFRTLVAIMPSPDRKGCEFAFRVYNVGQFLRRPHTLAIAALEIPDDGQRKWSIANLLAALTPPVPDSPDYQMPTEQQVLNTPVDDEPYKSLADWERHRGNRHGQDAVAFSEPQEIAVKMHNLLGNRSTPLKTPWKAAVGIFFLALCVGFIGYLAWRKITEPPSPPTIQLKYTREQLLLVLADSGAPLQVNSDFDHAAIGIITTAKELKSRLSDLASELEKRSRFPPGDSKQMLIRQLDRLQPPLEIDRQSDRRFDDRDLEAAISVHHEYQQITMAVDQLVKLDAEGKEFARDLNALRNHLEQEKGRTRDEQP